MREMGNSAKIEISKLQIIAIYVLLIISFFINPLVLCFEKKYRISIRKNFTIIRYKVISKKNNNINIKNK